MSTIVVSNTTPLIALGKLNQLGLLRALFGEVYIPGAVFSEVIAKNDEASRYIIYNSDWIHVKEVKYVRNFLIFKEDLHEGEVEAMILAKRINADMVLIDDKAARKAASRLGLPLGGSLAILLEAKKAGLISDVMPYVKEMEKNGIYSAKVIDELRSRAGE